MCIRDICYKDTSYEINDGNIGKVSKMMYEIITGIQTGQIEDNFGYKVEIL
jgi:hypothetical protein